MSQSTRTNGKDMSNALKRGEAMRRMHTGLLGESDANRPT